MQTKLSVLMPIIKFKWGATGGGISLGGAAPLGTAPVLNSVIWCIMRCF